MTINQLEKELKENKLSSIYLLYGQERYLLDNVVKKIKKSFGNLVDGLNYIKIDNSAIDNIISEIQTPAFGFERKLIIIKNTDLLKKQSKKKNQLIIDKIEKISEYIENNKDEIKDQNVIVFIEDDIEKNKLYKTIEKIGIVCNFEPEKPQELSNRIKYICNAYSVNIDNPTLAYFIECCGTNLQDLINEIRKLIEYKGKGGQITKEDIDILSIRQFDSVIFDLTDNLGKKDITGALQVLQNLIYAKEPLAKILVTLYNHFKKLYITKMALNTNKDLASSLNLKPNQMFLTSKYKVQAKYFKEKDLRNMLQDLTDLDYNFKNGKIDLQVGMETILCRYCSN